MANHLEQTWVAYAFERGLAEADPAGRALRVHNYTQGFFGERMIQSAALGPSIGHALWHRDDPRLETPLWFEDDAVSAASTSAILGLGGVNGNPDRRGLAEAVPGLIRDPRLAVHIAPPFTASILDQRSGALTIVNDCLGTARLYEIELPQGRVWSNRIGALMIFAGVEPRIDPASWQVLAATGWFLGETTAVENVRQLRSASIVEVTTDRDEISIGVRRNTDGLRELVAPRRARLGNSASAAAEAAKALATDLAHTWDGPVRVDLSGGRDSRVSAAAAIATGLECELRTSDLEYGELEFVQALVAKAPGNHTHTVKTPEREPEDSLLDRAAALHAVHDGMRNPQGLLRASMPLPHGPLEDPVMSGHGGEIGHGFYYSSKKEIRSLRRGGRDALMARLERSARKKHGAADEAAYAAYRDEAEITLDEAQALGIKGPDQLDYYYLAQRLANRSGLTTRNERWSACSTPEFIRACFDLSAKERLQSKMHRLVVAELVPEWASEPFFEVADDAPGTKRRRIWEKPGHSDEMGELIRNDDAWHDLFDVADVRRAWDAALRGDVHHHYEPVFIRIAWRATYERHLDRLAAATRGEPVSVAG